MKTFNLLLICLILTVSSVAQTKKEQTTIPSDTAKKDSIILNDEDKEIFRQETLKKIKSFQGYLTVIASKTNTLDTKNIYKELALDDFINKGEGVIMEVSYMSPITKLATIKKSALIEYLTNLENLSYTKVELKTAKSCYVSNLIKSGIDISGYPIYKATATYYQEFIGYGSDGVAIFKDITQKIVQFEIHYTPEPGGSRWIVSLGDICVEETK